MAMSNYMHKPAHYRCGEQEIWYRQLGYLNPVAFSRQIGGCEDFIKRMIQYAVLEGHNGCVNTVHFNSAGDVLISGSDDRKIMFWDWAAKRQMLSYHSGHRSNVFQARSMPFSNDRTIVSCAADGQVRLGLLSEDGKVETLKLANHRGRAHKLAVEPGSPRTFFSCGEDGAVRHFDLREHKNMKLFTCQSFRGRSSHRPGVVRLNSIVINSRNPNYFAVGGYDDEFARVYDMRKMDADGTESEDHPVDSFAAKHLVGGQGVHITCLAYSLQEELLVSYNDELIYNFNKDMGLGPSPLLESPDEATLDEIPQVYKGHRNAQTVKGVSYFGPNTEYVVSGSDCGRVFIWKKEGGKLLAMMDGDSKVVNCLEPHPSISVLATSGIDHTIKIWTPTADHIQPLPHDAEEAMENNHLQREGDNVILRVMRLHRQQVGSDFDLQEIEFEEDEEDEDDDDGTVHSYSSGEDTASECEWSRIGPQECIIS